MAIDGEIFQDAYTILSITDNGEPFKAGVYASFDGFLAVPEPATWTILLAGLAAAGIVRRRTSLPQ